MAVFGAILAVVLLNVRINGEITPESIEQFNIGELFAFYDTSDVCTSKEQFAVAKKVESNDCQWQIGKDLQPATITSEGLPIEDINGNCYFSCVFGRDKVKFHTEKVINRKLKEKGIRRSDFDLFTFIAPCLACLIGEKEGEETAELDKFNEVYYTSGSKGTRVADETLLKKKKCVV